MSSVCLAMSRLSYLDICWWNEQIAYWRENIQSTLCTYNRALHCSQSVAFVKPYEGGPWGTCFVCGHPVCLCVHMWMSVHATVWRGTEADFGIFINLSLLYILRQGLLIGLNCHNFSRLVGQGAPGTCHLSLPQQRASLCSCFLDGFWCWNSDPFCWQVKYFTDWDTSPTTCFLIIILSKAN